MNVGDIMEIPGPLGNWHFWDITEGKNVVVMGCGFAFTTPGSSIIYILDLNNRS